MADEEELFLIVDDEPFMCWVLENVLLKNGCSVRKALSGLEAVKLIESNQFRMAFLDSKLPDMEGLELATLLKRVHPSITVVMISGYFYKDDPTIQRALAEGLICDFIAKPFLHDDIVKSIEFARRKGNNRDAE